MVITTVGLNSHGIDREANGFKTHVLVIPYLHTSELDNSKSSNTVNCILTGPFNTLNNVTIWKI